MSNQPIDETDGKRFEPHDPEEFDKSLSPPPMLGFADGAGFSRLNRIARVVFSFVAGQGAIQIIGVLAGFFLVHRLSIEAYAQFGLATAMQGIFAILMDLGFSSTIVPLVGDRRDDPDVVGRYVRAARHLRNRSFAVLAPVATIVYLGLMHKHHWNWTVQLLLVASVLVSLYSGGKLAYVSTPLFLFGNLRAYYVPQVVTGVARFLIYVALSVEGGLNAWTAAGFAALMVTVNAFYIEKASRSYLRWPVRDDPAADRELLKYILPASPAIIFSAFQSQISLFLVSLFGGTIYIAEVMALSRIGVLFSALMTFNTIVIEPFFARQRRKGLLRTFAGFVLAASLLTLPLVWMGFVRPQWYVWLLGAKYEGVRAVMGWYVLSSSMNFVAGMIWIMNRARKWVFWSGSMVEVVVLLGVQAAFLAMVGVHTTRDAVMFNMASSCCYLVAHLYVTLRGFMEDGFVDADSKPLHSPK